MNECNLGGDLSLSLSANTVLKTLGRLGGELECSRDRTHHYHC